MLVLSRHRNEEVVITMPDGRLIRVLLCDIRSDKCRLGFDAPQDVKVHRKEIHDAIQAEGSKP